MKSRKRLLTIAATVAALVAVSIPVSVALAPQSKAAEPECRVYGPITITWIDNGHAGFCGRYEFTGPRSYRWKLSLKDAVRDGKDAGMQNVVYWRDPYRTQVVRYTNGTVGAWRTFEGSRPERREDVGCVYEIYVQMLNGDRLFAYRSFYNPYCPRP